MTTMADPLLRTHLLQTPRAMNASEFSAWESINRPSGRLFMESFHPEGSDQPGHHPSKEPYSSLSRDSDERFDRWVCVYKEYDPTTWGLIND